jgi:hypothetical protein
MDIKPKRTFPAHSVDWKWQDVQKKRKALRNDYESGVEMKNMNMKIKMKEECSYTS